LLDLGIESYLITATVNIAIGQRLVRKICDNCKSRHKLTEAEEKSLSDLGGGVSFDKTETIWFGKGCEQCGGSGYRGRIGIYEVMPIDDAIREAMLKRSSASDIKKLAVSRGMKTMVDDGFEKVAKGLTTIAEVLRVIHE